MGVKTCIWNVGGLCLFSKVGTVGSLSSVVSSSRPKLPVVKRLFGPIGELLVVCVMFRILMVVRPCWLPRCRGVRALGWMLVCFPVVVPSGAIKASPQGGSIQVNSQLRACVRCEWCPHQ